MILFASVLYLLASLSLLVSYAGNVRTQTMVAENWLTSTSYYTGYLRSDGTSSDPQALAEIPGRAPEWLADVAAGKQS